MNGFLYGNGREAIEIAREKKPDVFLMGIQMPEMDGIETTKYITGLSHRTEQHWQYII